MPTYICKIEDSDVVRFTPAGSFNKVMSPGVDTTATFDISIAPSASSINGAFIVPAGTPNSDTWESGGTFTCELRITVASNIRARCAIQRVDQFGTLIQGGTLTAFQTLTTAVPTTFTFTPTVPTWTASEEACGNRLVIRFNFDSVVPSVTASCTIEVGTTESEIISTITENNGNCRRIFIA